MQKVKDQRGSKRCSGATRVGRWCECRARCAARRLLL